MAGVSVAKSYFISDVCDSSLTMCFSNTYPGVQCDVPSHIYVSEADRSRWRRVVLTQAGISVRPQSRLVTVLLQWCRDPTVHPRYSEEVEPRPRRTAGSLGSRGSVAGGPWAVASDS